MEASVDTAYIKTMDLLTRTEIQINQAENDIYEDLQSNHDLTGIRMHPEGLDAGNRLAPVAVRVRQRESGRATRLEPRAAVAVVVQGRRGRYLRRLVPSCPSPAANRQPGRLR